MHFEKFCREHGVSRSLVWRDVDDYLRSLRYVKPAWVPQEFAGDASAACPTGCGFCSRHEQHLCMPIVEITSRCDLACPVCLVDAGQPWAMTRAEFAQMLDRLIAAERQIDILNLSGGEPLVHPEVLALIDEALSRPEIVRVSISTNGLALLREPGLLQQLQERNVVVSLQFDGFDPRAYERLRGRPLLAEKREILDRLRACGITTSLTMTVAGGVNDDQFPAVLDYFFAQPHIVSLMIQPLAFAGRGQQLARQRAAADDPGHRQAAGGGRPSAGAGRRFSAAALQPSAVFPVGLLPDARRRRHRSVVPAGPARQRLWLCGGVRRNGFPDPVGRCLAVAGRPGQSHRVRPGPRRAGAAEGHDLRDLERAGGGAARLGRRDANAPQRPGRDGPPAVRSAAGVQDHRAAGQVHLHPCLPGCGDLRPGPGPPVLQCLPAARRHAAARLRA